MLDRFLRLLVPSVPVLARTPLSPVLDVVDRWVRRGHPEWASLPPASLRMRIGVGNRILRNHAAFVAAGNSLVDELAGKGVLTPRSTILELGCGCGRNAIAFSRHVSPGGSYVGQDVDREMIAWCQDHLTTANTKFSHADIFSKVYNPEGRPSTDYRFPVSDGAISLVVSVSVFSHLLYADTVHYVQESARSLAKGGHLHMTAFIMDYLKDRLGDRWTFSHALDHCRVDSLRYPEAAVAYDLSTIDNVLSQNGLSIVEVYHLDRHQQTIIAVKK